MHRETVAFLAPLDARVSDVDWSLADAVAFGSDQLGQHRLPGATFDELPTVAANAKNYKKWKRQFADMLYRSRQKELYRSTRFKLVSEPTETEREFRIRLGELSREARDEHVQKLRKKFEGRFARLDERVRKAELIVDREQDDVRGQKVQTAVSLGATLLSAFLGRKATSRSTLGRATTTLRGAGRTAKQKGDVTRARANLEALRSQREDLAAAFEDEVAALEDRFDPLAEELDTIVMRPRKTDINVTRFSLVWVPRSVS